MIRHLLLWLTARLPARTIDHEGVPFLERYYGYTFTAWWRWAHRAHIHRFVDSDPDGLHNHPFSWSLSIVLAGWYMEERSTGPRIVRWFNWIGPDKLHRVVKPHGVDVWTIFVHGPRVKKWGIQRPGQGKDQYIIKGRVMPYMALVIDTEENEPAFGDWWKKAPTGAVMRAQNDPAPAVFRRRSRSVA